MAQKDKDSFRCELCNKPGMWLTFKVTEKAPYVYTITDSAIIYCKQHGLVDKDSASNFDS